MTLAKQHKPLTVKLSPIAARSGLRALAEVIEFLESPQPVVAVFYLRARNTGALRLLALLLERSLDEADQLAPRWPQESGSIYKIQPRKIPK